MKNKKSEKIIIIGGGVCGLSCGLELAKLGYDTDIYEKNKIGTGATNKSGGMLAGGIENEPSEQNLWELNAYSQSLWTDYKKSLEADSKIDIDYQDHGTMMVGTTADDMNQIEFLYNYQQSIGVNTEMLSARDITKIEPHLKTTGGMIVKSDHQVDSIKLTFALATAFTKLGGNVFEGTEIKKIIHDGTTATGIELNDGTIKTADKILIASGIDTPELLKDIIQIPIRPLKGQMLSLNMNTRLIDRVIWAPKTYLIPKSDNTLLIGATVEEQGLNNDITAGGIYSLLESAWRVLPSIEDLPIKDMWVGFRPTARDDAPILGKLPVNGLYMASGHHRNGILLAPATGKIMAQVIDTDTNPDIINNFTIDRFSK
ncbi:MAG: glycine oxidase ThiO [Alphaproteobacteria bacterium]